MFRLVCLALAFLIAASIAPPSATSAGADAALIARGHAIAKENCSRCHAIGMTDVSANPKSPPFRTLAQKYPLANLEEALSEGIMVGHQGPEMPVFQFDPAQIDALLAYIESVQEK